MKADYDIVIIGGGPSGATVARVAAEKSAKVLLVEENHPHSKRIQCTGLISLRALETADVEGDFILRKIKGAYIHTPGGRRLILDGGDVKALVIDRIKFDYALLRKAEEAGAEIRTNCKAVKFSQNRIDLKDNGSVTSVMSKVIIGADGPRSKIAEWAGLPSPKKLLPAIQVIVPYRPERDDFVEVFLGQKVAPNFFAWCVPSSDGYARVGLGTENPGDLKPLLGKLLRERFTLDYRDLGVGFIPIGVSSKTYTDNVLIVGDAAGQVKPTSGGGIYTGITCARIAGEVASKCALNGNLNDRALSEYEKRWRSLLYKELFFGYQVHLLLSRLKDEDIDRILGLFDSPKILELFTKYGDIDYPSLLARELFKRPALWGKLLSIIPAKEILTSLFKLITG